MTTTIVYVHVRNEHINDFIKATGENHQDSVKEKGNLRFDVLQDVSDPTKFVLCEAYDSELAAAAHKETQHYLRWRDAVSAWMAEPRHGVKYKMLFPGI